MIELLGARLRRARGDSAGSRELLQSARRSYPNYRPIGYALTEAYQSIGQHRAALDETDAMLREDPRDARLFGLKAKSLAVVGTQQQLHQALAEQYYLSGSLNAAIEQLQLAQKLGGGDFYQQSVLDARLRQMRAERGDEGKGR
jgi:predicted Zn-dependent protease